MRVAIATSFKVHSAFDAASANRKDRIAGLMRALVDLKRLAAKCERFGHEWKMVKATVFVQSQEDLFPAADFDPISDLELDI